MMPAPEVGEVKKCLVCAQDKPWGIFSESTGEAVCTECRDKAQVWSDRFKALIESELRYLAADPEADIDWDNIESLFHSYVVGHEGRAESALNELVFLKDCGQFSGNEGGCGECIRCLQAELRSIRGAR